MRFSRLESGRNPARKPDFRPGSTIASHTVTTSLHSLTAVPHECRPTVCHTPRSPKGAGSKFWGSSIRIDTKNTRIQQWTQHFDLTILRAMPEDQNPSQTLDPFLDPPFGFLRPLCGALLALFSALDRRRERLHLETLRAAEVVPHLGRSGEQSVDPSYDNAGWLETRRPDEQTMKPETWLQTTLGA